VDLSCTASMPGTKSATFAANVMHAGALQTGLLER